MFPRPTNAGIHCRNQKNSVSPCAADCFMWGGLFFHGFTVAPTTKAVIPHSSMSIHTAKTTYWPGSNVKKSTGNAFTVWPKSVFSDDPHEAAKATIQKTAAQVLKMNHSITLTKRNNGEIPQAFRNNKG